MPAPGMDLNLLLLRLPEETHSRPKYAVPMAVESTPASEAGVGYHTESDGPGALCDHHSAIE
jgi:hypothetical protein